MKTKFITLSVLLISALSANAQLEVKNTGAVQMSKNVAVNGAAIADSVSLCIKTGGTIGNHTYGVYAYSKIAPWSSFGEEGRACIMGHIAHSTSFHKSPDPIGYKFCAAVAGIANNGIGIYGATAADMPTSWAGGTYAGLFNGNVKVMGTITATNLSHMSDARLSDNITSLDNTRSKNILSQLRPVSYSLREDANNFYPAKDTLSLTHYGLMAQELQTVLPNLVHADEAGYLSVNYVELIPLLIQAVQSQQRQIEELSEIINSYNFSSRNSQKRAYHQETTEEQAVLYQNNPNPFSKETKIGYQLPLSVKTASVCIYNLNGKQIAEYPITSFGTGEVIINAGLLDAGIYLYSMIADGLVIDTKRMILTK